MPIVNLKELDPVVHLLVQNLKDMKFNLKDVAFWQEKDEYVHLVAELSDFYVFCQKIN